HSNGKYLLQHWRGSPYTSRRSEPPTRFLCHSSRTTAAFCTPARFPLISMSDSFFPRWRRVDGSAPDAVVQPDECLHWPQNIAMGAQHVVAMFGSTILAPLLMGFDPNVAILMSGFGTLIFFLFVRGR